MKKSSENFLEFFQRVFEQTQFVFIPRLTSFLLRFQTGEEASNILGSFFN